MKSSDVLVVGSGIAGLSFALDAAEEASVVVITKKERPESNTNYAQGGVAAVFGADDSFALHRGDTFVAGAGLCHPDAVQALVEEGPQRVRELIERGVRFTEDRAGLSLGREGGHSRRRIVRADDLTGREIERALLQSVADHPNIEVWENHVAAELILAPGEGRCSGAWVLDAAGRLTPWLAGAVLLATGGSGQVYRHTTNPAIATGDGVALAHRAGAVVANMEFVQFHPTALFPAEERTFLISEAVRGEGAVLRDRHGTAFMDRYHRQGSLAPRDVVARGIDREMKESGDPFVLLDCSAIAEEEIRARFPNILAGTAERGVDMLREPLPVVPAAHYQCGGVLTDTSGRTSIRGLFAAGETACTGVHGANRLASNSLLEALVYARRAARALRSEMRLAPRFAPDPPPMAEAKETCALADVRREIQRLMWERAGIVRSTGWLREAAARLQELAGTDSVEGIPRTPEGMEVHNLLRTARLIVAAALARRESRGLHFNVDHPWRDNERFLRDTLLPV